MTSGINQHEPGEGPHSNGDQVVLVAEKITKRFPGTVALDAVDFTVYAGAVNVLIGENGAGKSTLIKILAGVERATSGRLLLDGSPVRARPGLRHHEEHLRGRLPHER